MTRRPLYVLALAAAVLAVVAGDAFAGIRTATCRGNADYCVATVTLPRAGSSGQQWDIRMSGTNFRRIAMRVIPSQSRGSFDIIQERFKTGGSVYTFLLDAARGQPRGARIIMYFGRGAAVS